MTQDVKNACAVAVDFCKRGQEPAGKAGKPQGGCCREDGQETVLGAHRANSLAVIIKKKK